VYCGGSHPDSRGVRACWERSQGAEVGIDAPLPFDPEPSTAPPVPGPAPTPARPGRQLEAVITAPAGRGAPALGRHVLVTPGTRPPVAWAGCDVVQLGAAALVDPTTCVQLLRQAGVERTALVIEIDTEVLAELARPERAGVAPHEAGPRFEFERSTLHHLLVANSVDATGDVPTWWVLERAIELGATPSTDVRGDAGDVVLPDGSPAWLDGGPVQWRAPLDGVAVLHRVAVEHGSLVPFGPNTAGGSVAELAPDQLAAVTHDGGAARIIAPAGSGKTRVLTERTRHLVRAWRLPPSAIGLVAFNKRAQEEMRERLPDLRGSAGAHAQRDRAGDRERHPAVRPASATSVRHDRRGRGAPPHRQARPFPRKRNADPVATWIEALSLARLGLRSPERVESLYDGDVDGFRRRLPALPPRARPRRQGRLRRAGAEGPRDPARRPRPPAQRPSGRAG
jgi:DNA helicase-2/ATP-dependent DNA helicase PcrA